jgi:aspartate kinase
MLNERLNMKLVVMKFGGTSVGSTEAIDQTTNIIAEQSKKWDAVAVVVSAMTKVTDALITGAMTAAAGDEETYKTIAATLLARHRDVIEKLVAPEEQTALLEVIQEFIAEFSNLCRGVSILGEVTPRAMDAIVSFGERMNAPVVAAALRKKGIAGTAVSAKDLIVTDSNFQKAQPLADETRVQTRKVLLPLLESKKIPVITGFIGANKTGTITTLGRGGSDYSGALIGTSLDATEVWIWTDVDGVMTTDPRIVKDAHIIPILSANEISELSYFGAKVLHPKTIWPVIEREIPLWVKNTFNPSFPGTKIIREPESKTGKVKAVTIIKNLSLVSVEGRGMMGVPGIAARTFASVARQKASVLMISQASSEQSICFVIPTDSVPKVIKELETEFALELEHADINRVWSMDNIVIVTVVGTAIRSTSGLASKIFGALGKAKINIIAIAQGSSEYSISVIVDADKGDEAVRHIHADVINHK